MSEEQPLRRESDRPVTWKVDRTVNLPFLYTVAIGLIGGILYLSNVANNVDKALATALAAQSGLVQDRNATQQMKTELIQQQQNIKQELTLQQQQIKVELKEEFKELRNDFKALARDGKL